MPPPTRAGRAEAKARQPPAQERGEVKTTARPVRGSLYQRNGIAEISPTTPSDERSRANATANAPSVRMIVGHPKMICGNDMLWFLTPMPASIRVPIPPVKH